MKGITTYQQAAGAAPLFKGMIGTLTGLVAANPLATGMTNIGIPAQKVKNDTMYTNRLGLNLDAKATKDVTVHTRLLMFKSTGSQDESAITGSGTGPFFADRRRRPCPLRQQARRGSGLCHLEKHRRPADLDVNRPSSLRWRRS
jgi:hypothetical protein